MAETKIRGGQIKDASIALAKLDTSIIDAGGKLLATLLPAALVGAMVYKGSFDASGATTPTAAAAENKGHYYIVNVAGNGYAIGDWAVSNGATWDKIDNTEATETAATTIYDNSTSGLSATTVQGAIDELEGRVGTAEASIGSLAALSTTEKASLVGAINEANAKSAGNSYMREAPAGAVDGANTAFTLTESPFTGTVQVLLNGMSQEPVDDYTIAASVVTFVTAPQAGDKVRVIYFKA